MSNISEFFAEEAKKVRKSKTAPQEGLSPELTQRYSDILCNLSAAFDRYPNLPNEMPHLLARFGTQVDKAWIRDFLGNDPIFEQAIFRREPSMADRNPDVLGPKFNGVDMEYPYIIEKMLVAGTLIDGLEDLPAKANTLIEQEISDVTSDLYDEKERLGSSFFSRVLRYRMD